MKQTSICSIPECTSKLFEKALCTKHYQRLRRHGDVHFTNSRYKPLEPRFWSCVDKSPHPKGCWLWTGTITKPHNYGRIWYEGRPYGAHCISYFLHLGIMPKLFVLHSCDNSLCVNPGHLREGTQQENIQDAVQRGRNTSGVRVPQSKLTPELVQEIKTLIQSGQTQRAIAKRFDISQPTVSLINTGQVWRRQCFE